MHYADQLKEKIDERYKTDKLFYSVLSTAMSLIKLILDKKTPSPKGMKDSISKIAMVFN
jgi:hypothetical protein